jgi:hypothetical protein
VVMTSYQKPASGEQTPAAERSRTVQWRVRKGGGALGKSGFGTESGKRRKGLVCPFYGRGCAEWGKEKGKGGGGPGSGATCEAAPARLEAGGGGLWPASGAAHVVVPGDDGGNKGGGREEAGRWAGPWGGAHLSAKQGEGERMASGSCCNSIKFKSIQT